MVLSIGKDTLIVAVSFATLGGIFHSFSRRQRVHMEALLKPVLEKLDALERQRTRDSDRVNAQLQEIRRDFLAGDQAVRDDSGEARAMIRDQFIGLVKLIRDDVHGVRQDSAELRARIDRVLEHRTRAEDA